MLYPLVLVVAGVPGLLTAMVPRQFDSVARLRCSPSTLQTQRRFWLAKLLEFLVCWGNGKILRCTALRSSKPRACLTGIIQRGFPRTLNILAASGVPCAEEHATDRCRRSANHYVLAAAGGGSSAKRRQSARLGERCYTDDAVPDRAVGGKRH